MRDSVITDGIYKRGRQTAAFLRGIFFGADNKLY